jgi:DNA-binding phage protein
MPKTMASAYDAFVTKSLGNFARAKGMSQVALDSG